jgi:poly(3-hydroxyalkanoate) synthetase
MLKTFIEFSHHLVDDAIEVVRSVEDDSREVTFNLIAYCFIVSPYLITNFFEKKSTNSSNCFACFRDVRKNLENVKGVVKNLDLTIDTGCYCTLPQLG